MSVVWVDTFTGRSLHAFVAPIPASETLARRWRNSRFVCGVTAAVAFLPSGVRAEKVPRCYRCCMVLDVEPGDGVPLND